MERKTVTGRYHYTTWDYFNFIAFIETHNWSGQTQNQLTKPP